ncbi:hypothetical protein [Achromobacter xylosoxidans]|uniref:hypothetical protein n=1 Tax=Alcaligenes xylosoxydans xylosoxydans TaxID=85698 RepID=UPI002A762BD0|nr:hypothetical protein [Achromobacter xylosoxidans]WPQ34330.1 hypothetical protein SLH34_27570 [Achromobacter xylosoxidans]
MTNRAEFERLLDVYGFRCERFGQDLSTHARAQVVSAFAALASAPVADERQAVAYLDLGTGGYVDVGTDLTDKQLAALPKGRHMLAIIGTHGVDGYTPASAPVAETHLEWSAKALYDAIKDVLLNHRLSNWVDGDGEFFPLVDHLCSKDATTTESGEHEIALICDAIYNDALTKSAPVAGEAKNYPGDNVAERLDKMADGQPPGSQAQSDLYAAATIWRKHIAHRAAPQASEAVRTQVLAALESAQRFIRNGIEFGYIRMPDADTPDPAHRTPSLIDAAIRSLKTQADKDGGQQRAGDAVVAESLAHLRTLAEFGGTLEQAKSLAARGVQRCAALSATQAEQSEAPYWLCCGSKDPAHPGRQAPDCFDPERAKWGTRSQHATQAEQGERDA